MPIKSSLVRSAGKLFGVSAQTDLDLRGAVASRFVTPPPELALTNADSTNPGGDYKYITWIANGSFDVSVGAVTATYLLVGGGGEGAHQDATGSNGTPSTALGLTAYGGGSGGHYNSGAGKPGGSGGGGGGGGGAGSGNKVTGTPTTIPAPLSPQGNDGGSGPAVYAGAGGGGAGGAGTPAPTNSSHIAGAIGAAAMSGDANFPTSYGTAGPSPGRWFAAGGGGSGGNPAGGSPAQPVGGGGAGTNQSTAGNGVANTGSGGGAYTGSAGGGSGGGGAGGFLSSSMSLAIGPYTITIGSGGSGGNGGDGADGIFVLRVPNSVIIT